MTRRGCTAGRPRPASRTGGSSGSRTAHSASSRSEGITPAGAAQPRRLGTRGPHVFLDRHKSGRRARAQHVQGPPRRQPGREADRPADLSNTHSDGCPDMRTRPRPRPSRFLPRLPETGTRAARSGLAGKPRAASRPARRADRRCLARFGTAGQRLRGPQTRTTITGPSEMEGHQGKLPRPRTPRYSAPCFPGPGGPARVAVDRPPPFLVAHAFGSRKAAQDERLRDPGERPAWTPTKISRSPSTAGP